MGQEEPHEAHLREVLHLVINNSWLQYILGTEQVESSPAENDLGVILVDTTLNIRQQCTLAARRLMVLWTALGEVLPATQGR